MEYRRLGRTDLSLSVIGLGTMTWGEQNSEQEAHAQLDKAFEKGVNFIDTAEIYPAPPRPETQGLTEAYIGSWLSRRRKRDRVILATKVAGPGSMAWLRGGQTRLDRKNISRALDDSLRRLKTDYVDLYQLHWPDRNTNYFGALGYRHDSGDDPIPIEDTLGVLGDLVKAGKVRHVGLSNETAWGTMAFLRAADRGGLPRVASIQNPYSLLNRSFEIGLAEVSMREDLGLLAYSPLGMGVLTGKYLGGARPPGARLTLFRRLRRYSTPQAEKATAAYVGLAAEHGLAPAQMALAYAAGQSFVTSILVGATTLHQLETDIASIHLKLSDEVLKGIEAIHAVFTNPCP